MPTDLGDGDGADGPFDVPVWPIGDWGLYTFSTPRFSDDTTRLVVAENDTEDGTAYTLAISSHTEARRHAVLNHNPFLGRITHDNLSAYENGEPRGLFQFPFEAGDIWAFNLFATDWNATVVNVLSEKSHPAPRPPWPLQSTGAPFGLSVAPTPLSV